MIPLLFTLLSLTAQAQDTCRVDVVYDNETITRRSPMTEEWQVPKKYTGSLTCYIEALKTTGYARRFIRCTDGALEFGAVSTMQTVGVLHVWPKGKKYLRIGMDCTGEN